MKQKEEAADLGVPEKNNMTYHEDDRAQRLLNVFPIKEGQINISYINMYDVYIICINIIFIILLY